MHSATRKLTPTIPTKGACYAAVQANAKFTEIRLRPRFGFQSFQSGSQSHTSRPFQAKPYRCSYLVAWLASRVINGIFRKTDWSARLSDSTPLSTPYNHLVPSRAQNYSGIHTHRLSDQEKSSRKIMEGWMFGLVGVKEPRGQGADACSYF